MADFDLDATRAYKIAQLLVCLADMADLPEDSPGYLSDNQLKALGRPPTAGWRGRANFILELRADAASIEVQLPPESPKVLHK